MKPFNIAEKRVEGTEAEALLKTGESALQYMVTLVFSDYILLALFVKLHNVHGQYQPNLQQPKQNRQAVKQPNPSQQILVAYQLQCTMVALYIWLTCLIFCHRGAYSEYSG